MLLRVFVLLTLLFAATTPSLAETRQIAKVSASQLKSACDKVGGMFGDAVGGSTTYDCLKPNCDGKGGMCSVTCTTAGSCTGTTPRQTVGPQTLISLLQDGDLVLHDLHPAPTGSLVTPGERGTAAPAAPAAPADPGPGPLY